MFFVCSFIFVFRLEFCLCLFYFSFVFCLEFCLCLFYFSFVFCLEFSFVYFNFVLFLQCTIEKYIFVILK